METRVHREERRPARTTTGKHHTTLSLYKSPSSAPRSSTLPSTDTHATQQQRGDVSDRHASQAQQRTRGAERWRTLGRARGPPARARGRRSRERAPQSRPPRALLRTLTHLAEGLRVGSLLLANAHDHVHKAAVVLQALLGTAGRVLLLLALGNLGRLPAHLARTSERAVNLACRAHADRGAREKKRQTTAEAVAGGRGGRRPQEAAAVRRPPPRAPGGAAARRGTQR